ncbi:YkvA family protein [Algoriphagus marinus]|uniref:YkvA family protein n=1 Tax=Algoriphagus marinus TaxID=1925762 RepID=UPI00094B85E8|nr:YkvA family protein [Algoriphagus marinus]
MKVIKKNATEMLDKAKSMFGKQVENLARQEEKVRALISGVGKKLVQFGHHPTVVKLVEPVSVFIRMTKAHFNGSHKMAGSTLGLVLLGLIYFVSPIDIVPDFLGFIGFADDFSVVLAIYAKVKDEVEEFLEWERTEI